MRKAGPKIKKRSPLYVGSKLYGVRIRPEQLAKLDAWIERQPEPKPTVQEAIRRLTEKALACEAAQQGAT
jgi:hypothetical protein